MLDNPDDKGPVVYIIKETSPLIDKIEVGDRLVAVDEVDVRAMSPTKVSKLISKRSGNPMRKFTLLRQKKPPPKDASGLEAQQNKDSLQQEEKDAEEPNEPEIPVDPDDPVDPVEPEDPKDPEDAKDPEDPKDPPALASGEQQQPPDASPDKP